MTAEEVEAIVNLLESEKRDSIKESLYEAGEWEYGSTYFDSN